ncbi:MAG: hypothetical protein D4S01_02300 [Dehalococcoidia bacterium]|nr:MAG: hypothetical protein D4S01_02300 [Dehalococcoidia bacterium]
MKQVPQIDYIAMCKLGLIDFSISKRNCTITGKQKKSKARSYYVEERIVDAYNKILNFPKGI